MFVVKFQHIKLMIKNKVVRLFFSIPKAADMSSVVNTFSLVIFF